MITTGVLNPQAKKHDTNTKQLLILLTALFVVSCSSDEQKSKVDTDKVINQHQSDSKLNRVTIKDTNRILVKWQKLALIPFEKLTNEMKNIE